jgi:hypothetical protein
VSLRFVYNKILTFTTVIIECISWLINVSIYKMFNSCNIALFFMALGILYLFKTKSGRVMYEKVMHFENGVKWRNSIRLIKVRIGENFSKFRQCMKYCTQ